MKRPSTAGLTTAAVLQRMRAVRARTTAFDQLRRTRFGVLAYHRVGLAAQDPWGLSISPQHFDEQLTVLGDLGTIVRLGDGLDDSAGRRFRSHRPRFSITFDDGYVDNLRNAVELLERHDVPATVFIATAFIDQPAFWWDVLAEMALESEASPAQLGDAAERTRSDHR